MVLRGWGRGRRRIDDFADDGDDEPEKGTNFRERGERCPQADHGRARIIFCYGFDFGEEAMDGWMDGCHLLPSISWRAPKEMEM